MSKLFPKLSQLSKSTFLSSPSPTLNISLEEDVIFVNPPLNPFDEPTIGDDGPLLLGSLLLYLPNPKMIKSVKVVLQGLADVYSGYATKYESSISLRKELSLDLSNGGEILEAGNHAFKFCFIIPPNTSVFERSTFGRVRHSVRGVIEFNGKLAKDLFSKPVQIWITNNPAGVTEIPEVLYSVIQVCHDILGPIIATFSSPHLSLSSLLQLDLALSNPPSGLSITAIESYIQQAFRISYDSGQELSPKTGIHKLDTVAIGNSSTSLNSSPSYASGSSSPTSTSPSTSLASRSNPIATLISGIQFDHQTTFRLPGEDILRPSTLPSTSTRIKVSHKLTLALRYKLEGDEEEKVLVLSKGVMINSCSCLLDSLLLPEYAETQVTKVLHNSNAIGTRNPQIKEGNTGRPGCTCLEELVRDVESSGSVGSFRLPLTFDTRFEDRDKNTSRSNKSPAIIYSMRSPLLNDR